ncbi:hypothetical protein, partial [Verminephrobacter aporrectodeae]|uniref:hypothetical protein n=1 Tax=Verminephrobacter aporrectodeae TaxID=1110389 RepID=UPI00224442DD
SDTPMFNINLVDLWTGPRRPARWRPLPAAIVHVGFHTKRRGAFYTPAGVEEFFLAAGRPAINGVAPPVASAERTVREIEMGLHFHVSKAAQPN